MIKIENLTKIYKAKARTKCMALDSISITLPDKGLVFVLGKSGSGKSTLLNMIGGLDSFNSGDIISFGNSLASFKEKDYEAYRSDIVSFIFQDYHLIDELTVLENITLFNSDHIDGELLEKTLDTVGMREFTNRYPSELSGGQKQRVAIARGIMKDPKVILCDEPTGNLDRKTSRQILELLKKLSEEKLVVVVSHNLGEAEIFADRIIELADGRVIEDRTRDAFYTDGFKIEDGRATVPYHEHMNELELLQLNRAIRSGEVNEITVNTSGFEKTEIEYREEKIPLRMRPLGKKNLLRLFRKFFFSKARSAIATVLLSVIMFGIFAVIQSFIAFDADGALAESTARAGSVMAIRKSYTGYPKGISDNLSVLAGEKTYPLYYHTIWTNNPGGNSLDSKNRMSDDTNLSELYAHESYGILLCDYEYLADTFGFDGEVRLAAGSIDGARESGILITDYFADSLVYHSAKYGDRKYLSYDSLLGTFKPMGVSSAGVIAGIIDTDYEERYKSIFAEYDEYTASDKKLDASEIKDMIRDNPLYMDFYDDVILNLAVTYSLNPDYISSIGLEEVSIVKTAGLYLAAGGKEIPGNKLDYISTDSKPIGTYHLGENEIGLPLEIYNELFGTEYTAEDTNKLGHIEENTITLRRYAEDDPTNPFLYEREVRVVLLTTTRMVASEDVMLFIRNNDWLPYSIYVKDARDISAVRKFVEENDYVFSSREQKNMQRLSELIATFTDLFSFLEISIVVLIAMYLILFGVRSIRQNSYQIGVIKALGGRGRDVRKIFVLKTFIIGAIIAAVSSVASVAFIGFANSVLITSIETVIDMKINEFDIIAFRIGVIALDALIMLAVAFVSALLPTVVLKRIKPVAIIKAKE